MAVDETLIRELLKRGEHTTLDYKRDLYSADRTGNLDLTKDVMAMANALLPGQSAHLLIGVKELPNRTGQPIGAPRSVFLDDSDYQEKVSGLNRSPDLSLSVLQYEGLWLGVFEIRWRRRPFYPLKKICGEQETGKRQKFLQAGQAHVRVGTSTEVATPDQIYAWAIEDNPVGRDLQQLQLARELSAVTPRPEVRFSTARQIGSSCSILLTLHNNGDCRFDFDSCEFVVTPAPGYAARARGHGYSVDEQQLSEVRLTGKTPDEQIHLDVGTTSRNAVEVAFDDSALAACFVDGRSRPRNVACFGVCVDVVVTCRGPTGKIGTSKASSRFWGQG